jgi:hypothetical protein
MVLDTFRRFLAKRRVEMHLCACQKRLHFHDSHGHFKFTWIIRTPEKRRIIPSLLIISISCSWYTPRLSLLNGLPASESLTWMPGVQRAPRTAEARDARRLVRGAAGGGIGGGGRRVRRANQRFCRGARADGQADLRAAARGTHRLATQRVEWFRCMCHLDQLRASERLTPSDCLKATAIALVALEAPRRSARIPTFPAGSAKVLPRPGAHQDRDVPPGQRQHGRQGRWQRWTLPVTPVSTTLRV